MTFENAIQLLIPMGAIVVAALSAALTYYFTKKKQLLADETRLKEIAYIELINVISDYVLSNEQDKRKIAEVHNKILLIGSAEVVLNFRNFILYNPKENESLDEHTAHGQLVTKLVKSMRFDLYKNRKINLNYPIVTLVGINS